MNVGTVNDVSGMEHGGRWIRKGPQSDPPQVTAVEADRVILAQQLRPAEAGSNVESTDLQPSPERSERGAGVLRLLEAGHFRGVAGIRLRINFHDELAARAMERARPILERESGALIESVTAHAADLAVGDVGDDEGAAIIDALTARFGHDVRTAVDDMAQQSTFDAGALLETLRSAFEALIGELGTVLRGPDTKEEPDAEENESEPETKLSVLTAVETVPLVKLQPKEVVVTDAPLSTGPNNTEAADLPPMIEVESAPGDLPEMRPEEASPVPTSVTPAPEDAITALTAVFDEALASLLAAIEDAIRIPEPGAPKGNGVAFNKFLSIYEKLYAAGRNIDEQT